MGHAERRKDSASAAPFTGEATARKLPLSGAAAVEYNTRTVPADWYVDPADPEAARKYRSEEHADLDDAATAFLAEFDTEAETVVPGESLSVEASPAVWIGLPLTLGADPADEGELGWQADALCAQTDPEAFFPEKGGSTRDAKKVCGACTVKAQCLEYALSNDERFGIWGGMSERERRRLRKRAV